jgi:hypothetical protein
MWQQVDHYLPCELLRYPPADRVLNDICSTISQDRFRAPIVSGLSPMFSGIHSALHSIRDPGTRCAHLNRCPIKSLDSNLGVTSYEKNLAHLKRAIASRRRRCLARPTCPPPGYSLSGSSRPAEQRRRICDHLVEIHVDLV